MKNAKLKQIALMIVIQDIYLKKTVYIVYVFLDQKQKMEEEVVKYVETTFFKKTLN